MHWKRSELLQLKAASNGSSQPDPPLDTLDDMVSDIKIDSEVGAVVVGIDYDISYMKLMRAATYLSDPKCLFIATNEDSRLPSHGPVVIPGMFIID
jgi:phosphoglycolate phosphatase